MALCLNHGEEIKGEDEGLRQGRGRGEEAGVRTLADVGVADVPLGVLEVEGLALLAVVPHGVVLAVLAHAPAHAPRRHVHRHVEMARARMVVTVALCARDGQVLMSPISHPDTQRSVWSYNTQSLRTQEASSYFTRECY